MDVIHKQQSVPWGGGGGGAGHQTTHNHAPDEGQRLVFRHFDPEIMTCNFTCLPVNDAAERVAAFTSV